MPYSPLGRGFLTGRIRSVDQLDENDFRRNNPRFEDEALVANLRIVDVIEGVAGEVDATPAQVALAWLLAQGEDIVPSRVRASSSASTRTSAPPSSLSRTTSCAG
ncbi:aldo/keto reductase [Microbacterium sp. ARD31]|uniref:aldo/keto reductase n=1 Tax=Microbacterium sp. ARD31 TaxID=2962576 RepID=UPI0037C7B64D